MALAMVFLRMKRAMIRICLSVKLPSSCKLCISALGMGLDSVNMYWGVCVLLLLLLVLRFTFLVLAGHHIVELSSLEWDRVRFLLFCCRVNEKKGVGDE